VALERTASLATPDEDYESGGKGPMLIVQGKDDVIAPPSIGFGLRRKYGRDRITVRNIDGCGHAFPVEKPAKTAKIISSWLR